MIRKLNEIIILCLLSNAFVTTSVFTQDHKIGIIGLRHGHVWGNLPRMMDVPGVKVVGIAEELTVQHPHAQKIAPDVPLFTSTERLLSVTKPDIVWAFVENNRHLDIVKICAPMGIHVIFEKPLASTLKDAREIRTLAQRHKILVLTNYQMAWWPTMHAAYSAAKSGDIGEVWRLKGIVGHGGPGGGRTMSGNPETNRSAVFLEWLNDAEKNGGGALMDFGCYNALWSLMYLGKPQTVFAVTHVRRPDVYKVDDNADILLKYERGVALLEASWSLPRTFQEFEIFGEGGSIFADSRNAILTPPGRDAQARRLETPELSLEQSSVVAYMVDCLKNKRQPEGMTALDINVDVVEIIEAAKQSAKEGKTIKLPLK